MKKVRIISRLDIKGPNLVKGIHLEGLRVLGDPAKFAYEYYKQGIDEIFYMDCVASLYERNSLNDLISKTAQDIFIPLTVGGGLRTIEDIRNVLNAGADKVSINTAAIRNPEFITTASRQFGSSTIVATIEAIKQPDGKYLAFVDNGRDHTGVEVVKWAQELERLGAGEVVITSVDRDGTAEGFDVELIKAVVDATGIPIIAHGGASTVDNVCDLIKRTNVDAICIASALHYGLLQKKVIPAEYTNQIEGNTSFLNSGMEYKKISTFTLQELKAELSARNIACRL